MGNVGINRRSRRSRFTDRGDLSDRASHRDRRDNSVAYNVVTQKTGLYAASDRANRLNGCCIGRHVGECHLSCVATDRVSAGCLNGIGSSCGRGPNGSRTRNGDQLGAGERAGKHFRRSAKAGDVSRRGRCRAGETNAPVIVGTVRMRHEGCHTLAGQRTDRDRRERGVVRYGCSDGQTILGDRGDYQVVVVEAVIAYARNAEEVAKNDSGGSVENNRKGGSRLRDGSDGPTLRLFSTLPPLSFLATKR